MTFTELFRFHLNFAVLARMSPYLSRTFLSTIPQLHLIGYYWQLDCPPEPLEMMQEKRNNFPKLWTWFIDATCKTTCSCPFLLFFLDLAWNIPKKQLWLHCPPLSLMCSYIVLDTVWSRDQVFLFPWQWHYTFSNLPAPICFFLSGLRSTETFDRCNWSSGNILCSTHLAETVCFTPLRCTPDEIIILSRKDQIKPERVQI